MYCLTSVYERDIVNSFFNSYLGAQHMMNLEFGSILEQLGYSEEDIDYSGDDDSEVFIADSFAWISSNHGYYDWLISLVPEKCYND